MDDLGRGFIRRDGFAEGMIEELLAHRHAEALPTIITSNWTLAEMRERLSPRLIDRFRQWAKIVQITGPSLR